VSLPPGRPQRAERGYTLVAIAIFIAVLTILIAAVGPVIATVMKREREEELIFRGRQYARAITLFQKRYGRYPNTLKEMYDNRPRTIRKLWKDPMCRCDAWQPLILGTPEAAAIGLGGPGQPGQPAIPGQPFVPTPAPTAAPTPTPGPFAPQGQNNQGPIVGVRSRVHEEALREWRGQKFYDEWKFIAGDADREISLPPPQAGGFRTPVPLQRTPPGSP